MAREVWVIERREQTSSGMWEAVVSSAMLDQSELILSMIENSDRWQHRVVRYVPEDEK